MASTAALVLTVLGLLGVLLGIVLVTVGPQIIEGGYEEQEGGPFEEDERRLSPAGNQIRNTGWTVTAVGGVLLLLGTILYGTARRRVA